MRNSMATFFSLILIGAGILTIVWVTSGMLAPAQSQPAITPPGVNVPGVNVPSATPDSSATTLPPPVEYQIPTKEQKAEFEAQQAAQQAAQDAAAAQAAAQQAAQAPAAPAVPQQMNVPAPPTAADIPPPAMDLPPMSPPPGDLPAMGAPASQTEAFVAGIQNPEGYTYDPTGRRDPFRPFGQSQVVTPIPSPIAIPNQQPGAVPPALQPPTPLSPAEPLQQYDLAQLKVVGIVWEVRNPKAMVKDPLGKLHLVRKEAKIGRNNGFIAAIREGEVIVVEPSYGEGGVQTAITRTMTLIR